MSQAQSDQAFEDLLHHLRDTRGFDFTGYKRSSLMRRLNKRMEAVGIERYGEYMDYLQVHPDEFTALFNFLLINVTSFFRDPPIWDYLAEEIVPQIVKGSGDDGPIRVWCAGCASGEEAYSIAMLFANALGDTGFRERIKVFATDVDDEALNKARQAAYTDKEVEPVPPELRERFFDRNGSLHVFNRELRGSIIFGRHDLVQDPPISKVSLLVCRNTLMYLNAETQSKVMSHLFFALNDGGFLFLGKAEMLFTQLKSFVPVDMKRRIFTRAASEDSLRDRMMVAAQMGSIDGANQFGNHLRSRDAAFDAAPVAQILVDRKGYLTMANQMARAMFGLTEREMGRRFQDLELSFRPVDLRSGIQRAEATKRPETISDVLWTRDGADEGRLEIGLVPLVDTAGRLLGISIWFTDITKFAEMKEELSQSTQELETAMEELQSTNEELETTNEELQSTNEELETMNEELQSTNEELSAINDEVRDRGTEVTQINAFLESIMSSVKAAIVVVDRQYRVRLWSSRAEDLWGLRADEVRDQPFFNLDIGLGVDDLKQGIMTCLEGGEPHEMQMPAVNRRGKHISLRIVCTPLRGFDGSTEGAILLMEEAGTS